MKPPFLLPRFTWVSWTACEMWGEYEGRQPRFEWGRFVLEINLGRVDRVL